MQAPGRVPPFEKFGDPVGIEPTASAEFSGGALPMSYGSSHFGKNSPIVA